MLPETERTRDMCVLFLSWAIHGLVGGVVRLVRSTLWLCVLVLSGCTAAAPPVQTPPTPNYAQMSLRLKPGMSEREVITSLGQPTRSDLSTCGGNVGRPWQCKTLVYGLPGLDGLAIYFGQDASGAWVVNSWQS
jgi:hypothetical protein